MQKMVTIFNILMCVCLVSFARVHYFHQFKQNTNLYSEAGWNFEKYKNSEEAKRPKLVAWGQEGEWAHRIGSKKINGITYFKVELINSEGEKKVGWTNGSENLLDRDHNVPKWVLKEFNLQNNDVVGSANTPPKKANRSPKNNSELGPPPLMGADPNLHLVNDEKQTEAWVVCEDGLCPSKLISNRDYYSSFSLGILKADNMLKTEDELDDYFYAYRKSCSKKEFHQYQNEYKHYVKFAAEEFKLPQSFLACIAFRESRWDQNAVSPTGPKGLMQFQKTSAITIANYLKNDSLSILEQQHWDLQRNITGIENQIYGKEVGEEIDQKFGNKELLNKRLKYFQKNEKKLAERIKRLRHAEKSGKIDGSHTFSYIVENCKDNNWNSKTCKKRLGANKNSNRKNYYYIKHLNDVSKSFTKPWMNYWNKVEDLPIYRDNYASQYMYYETPTTYSAKVGRTRAPNALAAGALYFKHIEYLMVKDRKIDVSTPQKALDYYAVMAAGYNAGEGHITQNITGNDPSVWKDQVLKKLSPAKKKEVIHYMDAVQNCMSKGNMNSVAGERMCSN